MEPEPAPEPADGEALVKVRYLSIDPTIRTWMDDVPSYLPPIQIGEVIRSGGVGEVIESRTDAYRPGQLLFGMTGWQDYVIADAGEKAMTVLPDGVPPGIAIGILGVTGMTAYFGVTDVGQIKEGDVVVVSGAAGATGSAAGQIAKIKGAKKVVGIAGGPEKCAHIVDELGFDEAIDYKSENVAARLHDACPDGIDLYFDNVGGDHLVAALDAMRLEGRVALCGMISQFDTDEPRPSIDHLIQAVLKRITLRGFIVRDHEDLRPEFEKHVAEWLRTGEITSRATITDGLEHASDAFLAMLAGGNVGKALVRIGEERP
jgi:NADPH-dependent curcumin reductase CurA